MKVFNAFCPSLSLEKILFSLLSFEPLLDAVFGSVDKIKKRIVIVDMIQTFSRVVISNNDN